MNAWPENYELNAYYTDIATDIRFYTYGAEFSACKLLCN